MKKTCSLLNLRVCSRLSRSRYHDGVNDLSQRFLFNKKNMYLHSYKEILKKMIIESSLDKNYFIKLVTGLKNIKYTYKIYLIRKFNVH